MAESGALPETFLAQVRDGIAAQARQRSVEIRFEPGLSDAEVMALESLLGSTIPPDLRSWLQFTLPIGVDFPNWRADAENQASLAWDSVGKDIAFIGDMWLPQWGERPDDAWSRLLVLKPLIQAAPPLFRLYAHRYIPLDPPIAGNPVFSIWEGTDVVYYGYDLAGYLAHEFLNVQPNWRAKQPRPIRFWDDLIAWNSRRS